MTSRTDALRDLPTVPQMSLDDQIALAEQAVIRRDERIRRRTDSLVRRAKSNVLRHAGGGLLVGVAGVAMAWWLNRRKAANAPAAPTPAEVAAAAAAQANQHSTGEHIAREAGLSLAAMLPLIWPYMPQILRRSVSPGTASSVLSFVSPMVARLFRRRPAAAQHG